MLALLDGDVITYACGFACEKVSYLLTTEDGQTIEFKYKKEADQFIKDNNNVTELVRHVGIPPVEHAYNAVKEKLYYILERVGASDVRIFLTGSGNYRDTCSPLLAKYKGHRDKQLKPAYYEEIREYLIRVWNAQVIDGMEADDAMGIEQTRCAMLGISSCICTIDKDLDQIPGLHYNWGKDIIYNVDPVSAIRWYYYQMLRGDPTDNIAGIPRIGDVGAKKFVDSVEIENLPHLVKELYVKEYGDKAEEYMEQTSLLITIRTEPLLNEPKPMSGNTE